MFITGRDLDENQPSGLEKLQIDTRERSTVKLSAAISW